MGTVSTVKWLLAFVLPRCSGCSIRLLQHPSSAHAHADFHTTHAVLPFLPKYEVVCSYLMTSIAKTLLLLC